MRRKPVVLTRPQSMYLDAQVQELPPALRDGFRREVFARLSGTVGDGALMASITTVLTDGYCAAHGAAPERKITMNARTRTLDDDDPSNPFDRNGLLKDGARYRVSLMDARRARDGDDDSRRRHKTTIYDPLGRIAAVHEHDAVRPPVGSVVAPMGSRPGFVTSAALDAARGESKVLALTLDAISRMPASPVATPARHAPPTSFADAEKIRRDAWLQSVDDLTNAWKAPA